MKMSIKCVNGVWVCTICVFNHLIIGQSSKLGQAVQAAHDGWTSFKSDMYAQL